MGDKNMKKALLSVNGVITESFVTHACKVRKIRTIKFA